MKPTGKLFLLDGLNLIVIELISSLSKVMTAIADSVETKE